MVALVCWNFPERLSFLTLSSSVYGSMNSYQSCLPYIHNWTIYTIILLKSVGVRKLQVSFSIVSGDVSNCRPTVHHVTSSHLSSA